MSIQAKDITKTIDFSFFSGPDATGVIRDSSGYGNDGTPNGFVGDDSEFEDGFPSQAVSLSGGGHIRIADSPSLDGSQNLSLEAIVKFNTIAGTQMLFNIGKLSTSHYLYLRIAVGANLICGYNGGFGSISASVAVAGLNLLNWTHIVATVDASDTFVRIYINGILKASTVGSSGVMTTNQGARIGQDIRNFGDMDGLVSRIRYFRRAMGAAEVYERYLHMNRR